MPKFRVVSTHSRPKAAAYADFLANGISAEFQHTAARRRLPESMLRHVRFENVSTHSRPKAAAITLLRNHRSVYVSTHSRPKAAAFMPPKDPIKLCVSTHSRPKAAAFGGDVARYPTVGFQHTAARRRLLVEFW